MTEQDMNKQNNSLAIQPRNAWAVRIGERACLGDFTSIIKGSVSEFRDVKKNDAILIVENSAGRTEVIAVARMYCKRSTLEETTFYFDAFQAIDPAVEGSTIELALDNSASVITRLDWAAFERILQQALGMEYDSLTILQGESPKEQAYIRQLLQNAVIDDLLGPANGPEEEIIGMSVRDRYLIGKLAPMSPTGGLIETLPFAEEDVPDGQVPNDLKLYANEDHISSEKVPASDFDDDEEKEIDTSTNQSLVPSSMGFTFCVDGDLEEVELSVSWGRYERVQSEQLEDEHDKPRRCWKRIPSGGTVPISLKQKLIRPIAADKCCPAIIVQGTVSEQLNSGDRLVTLFLVNTQREAEKNRDQAWIFQPEMSVRGNEGSPVFRRRPFMTAEETDDEREALEMIYRERVEFAVGHGVSVSCIASTKDPERAVEIKTSVLPEHEIPVTETPGMELGDRPAMRRMIEEGMLDMERIATLDREALVDGLHILTNDYAAWISEQQGRVGHTVVGYDSSAAEAMEKCIAILQRLNEGVAVLESNDQALEAFRFSNRAMADQRIHSIYALKKRRGEDSSIETVNVRPNRSWRPFQLAFLLLSIPGLADPTHSDRTQPIEALADLLWFPTGGGKTEAYLGVAAFAMSIRRLQGKLGGVDGGRGLSVIMRYTLRMLTLQQFQRATVLICAMEVLRRLNPKIWGEEPFSLGLWVGQKVTPNSTEDSHIAIEKERDRKSGNGSSPAQLTSCPWCGAEIVPGRDIEVNRDQGQTWIFCGDKYNQCDFSRGKYAGSGLPVRVVDEEIYHRPPSMLIATVDKFAMMAWRGQVRTLFGKVDQECPRHGMLWPDAECTGNHQKKRSLPATTVKSITPLRPPDLIIQDEFHLISGPLGTMVGLYETAVDDLATWKIGDKAIRPKVIASTATVRKAETQVNNVFLRKVAVFPPHGLDVEDNFFSVQRDVNSKPGRRYLGICSPGSSRPAVLIRVYVALLTGAQSLFEHFGIGADPYMTAIGYFNSMRELAGMRRLAEDDVQTRSFRVVMGDVIRPGLSQRKVRIVDELTSRVSSKLIPKKLDQLEIKFKSDSKANKKNDDTVAIDIVLATNMFSVGVDVNRLGLMVVNGQPKNTAEYIQATSRVGRVSPGLVCTVLTWSRPRDLSHYETFEHYHSTFYKHVEAQSVTPFAPRALDRGLTGAMTSIMRLKNEGMNPNLGAQQLDSVGKPEANEIKLIFKNRAWKATGKKSQGENAEKMVATRIDRWVKEAVKPGRQLGYQTKRGQGTLAPLLKKPGILPWDELTVPMSMREVEPDVQLIMDVAKLDDPPQWKLKTKTTKVELDGGEA